MSPLVKPCAIFHQITEHLMGLFGKKYDAFLSYKSKNVAMARLITDRMIASRKAVWFNEYQVLLFERSRFQDAIDKGIRKCKYGIALTNDDYASSEYCEKEMVQLLEFCGVDNIIEIMIPQEPKTHRKYPQLKDRPAHVFTGDVEAMLDFIIQKTRWRIKPSVQILRHEHRKFFEGDCLGKPYEVDVTGWELIEKSFQGGGPCYVQDVEGRDIFWNLQYGQEYSPKAYEARFRLSQKSDRDLYNELCDYANHYFSHLKPDFKVVGVHLFFLENISNFALTYHDGKFWKRRYSIMLRHPQNHDIAEFVFTFQVSGSFKQYCCYVELMDDLVMTLRWGERTVGAKEPTRKAPPIKPSQKNDKILGIIEDQPRANQLYHEGMRLAKQGQIMSAIATWDKALEYTTLAEMRGAVLFNMGLAYEKSGDEGLAIECYKRSCEVNPKQFNSISNIGSIYLRKRKSKEALKYLLKAAKGNPNDYITVNNIVVSYEDLGNSREAKLWRAKLHHLKPTGS